jgi:large subunit ribosomal protein L17
MRHRKQGRKLGRTKAHREAMFRNLVVSLFEHERVETTDAKAKELRGIAERLITKGKQGTLHARRVASRWVRDSKVLQKLFEDIAGRYTERPGGYTRVMKLRSRRGDNAPLSIIELMPAGVPVFKTGKKADVAEAAPVTSKESFEEQAVEAVAEEAPAEEALAEEAVEAVAEEESSVDGEDSGGPKGD